jgi:hypothetical protein
VTNEQLEALFEELVALYGEAMLEARALRQMLADHKVIDEQELEARIADLKTEEILDLKAEMYRRAFEKALKDRPVQ